MSMILSNIKFPRSCFNIVISLILLLLFTSLVHSQNITSLYFTSEEEIEDALSREDISYTQYLLLIELVRDKVNLNGEEINRLLDIPGITQDEVFKIYEIRNQEGYYENIEDFRSKYPYDFEQISLFVVVEPPRVTEIQGKLRYYTSHKYEYGYTATNYIYGQLSRREAEMNFKLSQKGKGSTFCDRRSIEWGSKKGNLILGSFYYGWAEGVLVGRFPYFSTDLRRSISSGESFIYPVDHYFNGIRWEKRYGRFHPGMLLSYKKFDYLSTMVISGKLGFSVRKNLNIGVALMTSNIKNRDISGDEGSFEKSGSSIFLDGKVLDFSYSSELTRMDDGEWGTVISLYQRKDKISNTFSLWNYSDEFTNPYCSGDANYDYSSDDLDSTEFEFHNSHAGELGTSFSSKVPLFKQLDLKCEWDYWKYKPEDESNGNIALTLYYKPHKDLKTQFYYEYLRKHITGELYQRESYRITTSWQAKKSLDVYLYINYRRNYSPEYKEYFWLQPKLKIDFTLIHPMYLEPYLKYYDPDLSKGDDSYLEFGFKHEIEFKSIEWYFRYTYREYLYDNDNTFYIRIGVQMKWK